jgi:hypothetical protein
MPHSVLDAPISPLRQRLIDDMTLRRFSHTTGCRNRSLRIAVAQEARP